MEQQPEDQPGHRLEQYVSDSWQAELIISGAATVGVFQLPSVLETIIHYGLVYLDKDQLTIGYFIGTYLYLAVFAMIGSLLIHFVYRSYWVGLLGIYFTNAKGIRWEGHLHTFAPETIEKLKKEFKPLPEYIHSINKTASQIFALAFNIIFVNLSICLTLLLIITIGYISKKFFPEIPATNYFLYLLAGFVVFQTVVSLLFKKFRNSEFAKKYHFHAAITLQKIMLNFFYYPITFSTYYFSSLMKESKYILNVILLALAFSFSSVIFISNSEMIMLLETGYHNAGNRPYSIRNSNFETYYKATGEYIHQPAIPSYEVNTPHLPLFLPDLAREKEAKEAICKPFRLQRKNESDHQYKIEKANHENKCLEKYYSIYLNDSLVNGLTYKYIKHAFNGEPGYSTSIPLTSAKPGLNTLKITYPFFNEDKEPRQVYISFLNQASK